MCRKIFIPLLIYLTFVLVGGGFFRLTYAQQAGKAIIVSEKLGPVIDLNERNRFKLFQQINGFQSAIFFQLPDSSFLVKIVYIENLSERTTFLRNLSTNEIERVREHVDQFEDIPVEIEKKPPITPEPLVRRNQSIALAVYLSYYAPSLSRVNELIGDVEGTDFPSGPGIGYRVIISKIQKVLFLADYYWWTSTVRGETELYRIEMRLKVQSINITGLYKIYRNVVSIGMGFGYYFAGYKDAGYEKELYFKNNAFGLHVCAGLFEGPNNKLFNFSLEGRYVFATIGATNEGFPKSQLSGPMITLSIMF